MKFVRMNDLYEISVYNGTYHNRYEMCSTNKRHRVQPLIDNLKKRYRKDVGIVVRLVITKDVTEEFNT